MLTEEKVVHCVDLNLLLLYTEINIRYNLINKKRTCVPNVHMSESYVNTRAVSLSTSDRATKEVRIAREPDLRVA